MSRNRKSKFTSGKSSGSKPNTGSTFSKGYRGNKNNNGNNFQDKFADREFSKGVKYAIDTSSKDNDPNWYSKDAALTRDAASIPFSLPTGFPLKMSYEYQPTIFPVRVPGIMRIRWCPTLDNSSDAPATDAINIASVNLFAQVRKANSGAKNYDPVDLMMYVLATTEAYSYYAMLTRIYAFHDCFSIMNRNVPRMLIETMGVDYDDVINNLADFRLGINLLCKRLQQVYIPKDIDYLRRHIWMNETVYTDAESVKPQLYLYVQTGYLRFIEKTTSTTPTPAHLDITFPRGCPFGSDVRLLSVQELLDFGNQLIDPIIASEDIGIMAGDMMKAFGVGNAMAITPIAETYSQTPSYSKEVLSQFENSTSCLPSSRPRTIIPIGGFTQTGDVGASIIINNVGIAFQSKNEDVAKQELFRSWSPSSALLNMHHDDVKPEEVLVATRMINLVPELKQYTGTIYESKYKPNTSNINGVSLMAGHSWSFINYMVHGTEMLIDYEIKTLNAEDIVFQGTGFTLLTDEQFATEATGMAASYLEEAFATNGALQSFDWHPITMDHILYQSSATVFTHLAPLYFNGDIDNYTLLQVWQLENMNKIATISLFNIPEAVISR